MKKKILLEIKNVTVKFPQQHTPVFENINFSVTENCIFGIFGETGCGKSTIAKCLTGFLPQKYISGEIWLQDSIALHKQSPQKFKQNILGEKIVYVPQDPYQTLNPHEPLELQLERVLSLANDPSLSIEKIIGYVQLPMEKIKVLPTTLSAGQRQRGTIALALARKPKIIIFDEPTASLDRNTRKELLHFFAKLTEEKLCTILVISHEIFEYFELIAPENRFYFNEHQNTKISFPTQNDINNETILQTLNVSKSYSQTQVLQNIDFSVQKGQWVYLHGKNGCGKSTLIHLISGVHSIDQGKIFWHNEDVSLNIASKQKYIHLVFQDSFYSFHPQFTVKKIWDEVILCDKDYQQELTQFCGVWREILEVPDKIYHSLPKQISYGQQKRVSLLRTLLKYQLYHLKFPKENHLFLLDEVFAGIHLQLRYKIIQNLQNLYDTKQNFAIIWIAHGQDQLQNFCHKSYLLHNGVLKMT